MHCAVPICKNSYGVRDDLQLHSFPIKKPELCSLWVNAIKRDNWQPNRHSRICSDHFCATDYDREMVRQSGKRIVKILKNDAVPSLLLPEEKMPLKRKRVVLTLSDKLEIINKLKAGISGKTLADEYGVGTSTISDIKKNSNSIVNFVSVLDSEDGLSRKTMKRAENDSVDSATYTWFLQKRLSDEQVSEPKLCEIALKLNQSLGGDPDFKASTGWLRNFKIRHGIETKQVAQVIEPIVQVENIETIENIDSGCTQATLNEVFLPNCQIEIGQTFISENVDILYTEPQEEEEQITIEYEPKHVPKQKVKVEYIQQNNDRLMNNVKGEMPSHSETIKCIDTTIKWLEHQEERTFDQLLCLQKLRSLAALKAEHFY